MARKQYFSETTPLFKYQEAGTVMPADVLIDPVKLKQWMKDHPEATVTNANKQVIKDPRAVRVDPRLLKNTPKVVPAQGTIDYPASDPRSQSYTGAPATTLLMNPNQVQGEGARIIEGGNNLPILAAIAAPGAAPYIAAAAPIVAPAEGAANILFGYQGLKAAGQAVNDFRNYDYDQGLINSGEAVLGIAPAIGGVSNAVKEVSPFVRNATVRAAKALGTEEGLLSNTYKINPFAFKPNPEAYYRMIGQEGYIDALESGLLRSNPGKGGLQTQQFDDVYFSMKHPWDGRNYGYVTKSGEPIGGVGYKGPYMAELTGQELNHPISSFPRANMAQSKVPISLENPGLKLYKQDWLRGYKEVPKLIETPSISNASSFNNAVKGTDSFLNQVLGELVQGRANKKAIKEGNEWLENWIKDPATQAKIDRDIDAYDIKKEYEVYKKTDPGLYDYLMNNSDNSSDHAYIKLIKDQSKNFKPNSKEYSLFKQADENLQQYINKEYNQKPIHLNNYGVSYQHSISPMRRDYIESGIEPTPRRYGSWISRSSSIPQAKRTSTTVHEGTHDWVSAEAFDKSGMKDFAIANMNPDVVPLYNEWAKLRKDGIDPTTVMGNENAYMGYLADPTEQHARIMELRKFLNLRPGEVITPERANNIMNMIAGDKTPITSDFMHVVDYSPTKLANLFNRFWAAPLVATGAAAAATPKILQNYQGLQQHKNGGWLNKYK